MRRTIEQNAPADQFRVPDGWGKDELTQVLEKAATNWYYTVNRNRARVKRHRKAMELFSAGAAQYSEIRGAYTIHDERFFSFDYALPFFMSCRVSLVAALTLAFSHQLPDSAKPARGALEAAFYGFHVFNDRSAWQRWTQRPLVAELRGADRRTAARKQRSDIGREFSVTAIAREFPKRHSRVASEAVDLYDELIDVGGHFNMPAFQAMASVSADEHSTSLHFTVLGADDYEIHDMLDRLDRTACACLRIFGLVFGELWERKHLTSKIANFTANR